MNGTPEKIVKMVYVCDEDILNHKNAVNRLMNVDSKLRDKCEVLEIFTMRKII